MKGWQDPESFAIWLGVVILVILILSVAIVLITKLYVRRIMWEQAEASKVKINYQRQLVDDSIVIQETERERIAADLHDELISKLNVVRMVLYNSKIESSMDPVKMLEDGISLSRRISHDLMPPLLEETEFIELFHDFVFPLKESHNLNFKVYGDQKDVTCKDMKLQLFRICQEVINNIIRHAKATSLDVEIRFGLNNIFIRVTDDGVGFDVSGKSKGLGLKNIELRTQFIKGQFKFKSVLGVGTRFLLLLKS